MDVAGDGVGVSANQSSSMITSMGSPGFAVRRDLTGHRQQKIEGLAERQRNERAGVRQDDPDRRSCGHADGLSALIAATMPAAISLRLASGTMGWGRRAALSRHIKTA